MKPRRVAPLAGGLATLVIVVGLAAGCASNGHAAGTSATTAPSTASTTSSPATVAGQLPTVGNCGGGAYKPATLLIVCGAAGEMATGVRWESWDGHTATGTGTVHLSVQGQGEEHAAHLVLTGPVTGPVGPQFSKLTVTWIGTSPDGHPTDVFHLAPGG